MPEIFIIFLQWSWSGVCTLNSSLPESRWSHPRSCRTNRRSPCGPAQNMWMWTHLAGICPLKFYPPTRPWHPTCPTLRGPIVLISDWQMREGHIGFYFPDEKCYRVAHFKNKSAFTVDVWRIWVQAAMYFKSVQLVFSFHMYIFHPSFWNMTILSHLT